MSRVCVRLLPLAFLLLVPSHSGAQPGAKPQGLDGHPPNIVLILSDDQRWDTMPRDGASHLPLPLMPALDRLVVSRGVSFTSAFVTNPVCGPFRASLLSGGFSSANTGVIGNRWPNGGARRFYDARSLSTLMKGQGYRTALVGKYLNFWETLEGYTKQGQYIPPGKYVPPGWDVFVSKPNTADWYHYPFIVGTSKSHGPTAGLLMPFDRQWLGEYFSSSASARLGSTLKSYLLGVDVDNPPYVTDFEKDVALAYLAQAGASTSPFFLMISTESCHGPAEPEPEDQSLFSGFEYRARSWGEQDLSDKPEHVQTLAAGFDQAYQGGGIGEHPDEFVRNQLRSLRSLDRLVEEVVVEIDSNSRLRGRTVVIFASDNGLLWGEHRLFGKFLPYEESARVPLVIRAPGVEPRVVSQLVAADLDVAATVLDIAGVSKHDRDGMGLDGVSLVPILKGLEGPVREELVLHGYRFGTLRTLRPSWAALRTRSHKLIDYDYLSQGVPQEELYDLRRDPTEQISLHADPSHQGLKAAMASRLSAQRALVIEDVEQALGGVPSGRVSMPYSYQFNGAGGTPPYSYDLFDDGSYHATCPVGLPPGLSLATDGALAGTPTQPGCWEFLVRITDSSISPHHGGPQWLVLPLQIIIE
ncbi:MAG: sulfatase-like hydrolase/transferase [Planctomycetota bacterium]